MPIIKLNATNSTNTYLKTLCTKQAIEDFTVVITKKQTEGRGQMGAIWNSQSSKNLTFSVYKDVSNFKIEHAFYISMVVSLAIIKSLQQLLITKLSIKWPNDILSENKKICGILIENSIKQNKLSYSIIGIGLNVNQTEFNNLPQASSLKLITGKVYNLDEVVYNIIKNLKHYFNLLKKSHFYNIKQTYENYLFRKGKPSTFQDSNGVVFSGFIINVSNNGNLKVLLEGELIKEFDLKAIKLLY